MSVERESVKACPCCGRECRVYKCECDGEKHDPVEMPQIVAERLRALYREVHPPRRLTATSHGITVWVEHETLWLRPGQLAENPGAVARAAAGWKCLRQWQWISLRDTIDDYFEALAAPGHREAA